MSTGLRFTLEVDGLPPDAFAVVSFHLNQSHSSLFSLDLSLVSQQFLSLEFQQILDKMAYLTIWQGDDVQRRVKGVVPEDVRLSPHAYLAANSLQGPWWILSWPERVPEVDEVLPPEPPAYRVLTGVVDGFGRTLAFHREAAGELAGEITRVTDGAGRRFHLALSTQAQRAEAFRKQRESSLSSPAGPRSVSSSSSAFPDTLPAGTEYGADNGIRLEAVWLTHDPA